MRKFFAMLVCSLIAMSFGQGIARAEVRTQDVEYKQGDTVLQGFLAYDDSIKGKRPGVLVVHEWTGLGPYVKRRCEQLARLGYVAFGADIYGKGVRPESHEEAGKVSGMYVKDRALLRARVKAGLDELSKNSLTDPSRLAAMGYCFGGASVLELARSGADVAGVASFHGMLASADPADAKKIKAAVLVHHGADDKFVDMKQVDGFIQEMKETKGDWRVIIYGGAGHSFTVAETGDDPSKGMAYDGRADSRSWEATMDF